MKLRNHILPILLYAVCGQVSQAQKAAAPAVSQAVPAAVKIAPADRLEAIVLQARTQPMTPHDMPPAWMDYDRVRLGSEFLKKHGAVIQQTLGTSSLAASYAGRDTVPVVMQTGELAHEFSHRLKDTETAIYAMLKPHNNRQEFVTNDLTQAYNLGMIHLAVAKQTQKSLNWNPRERLVMNQQSFAFVFYTFSWWPVEALVTGKQITLENGNAELEGWLHLWCVLGYEMGVSEELLPTSVARAQEIVALLRKAQYRSAGESVPEGIPVLLGAQLHWLSEEIATRLSGGKSSPEQMLPLVASVFAQSITQSPGLSEAMGLGDKPAVQLLQYAALPAQRKIAK